MAIAGARARARASLGHCAHGMLRRWGYLVHVHSEEGGAEGPVELSFVHKNLFH